MCHEKTCNIKWMLPQSRQSAKLFLQSLELGLPHPSPAGECAPPLVPREGHTRLRERGGGVPVPRRGHSLWYSLYLRTLWILLFAYELLVKKNIF
jgi:hypothetical protein